MSSCAAPMARVMCPGGRRKNIVLKNNPDSLSFYTSALCDAHSYKIFECRNYRLQQIVYAITSAESMGHIDRIQCKIHIIKLSYIESDQYRLTKYSEHV